MSADSFRLFLAIAITGVLVSAAPHVALSKVPWSQAFAWTITQWGVTALLAVLLSLIALLLVDGALAIKGKFIEWKGAPLRDPR